MMMMMMNCFCGMVNRRKVLSFTSRRDHCQRSSPLRISDTSREEFEPAQNLSSGLAKRSCAIVKITTPWQLIKYYRAGQIKWWRCFKTYTTSNTSPQKLPNSLDANTRFVIVIGNFNSPLSILAKGLAKAWGEWRQQRVKNPQRDSGKMYYITVSSGHVVFLSLFNFSLPRQRRI